MSTRRPKLSTFTGTSSETRSTSTRSTSTRKPSTRKPSTRATATTTSDMQQAYRAHLPEAMALPVAQVRPLRGDANLAVRNVTLGLAAIDVIVERLRKELPALDWSGIGQVRSLSLAVLLAARRVNRSSQANPRVQELLQRAARIRRRLLTVAGGLVETGLLPAADVDHIRAGYGLLDRATDCVQLAELFRAHAAALAGKSSITDADLDEASAVGSELAQLLKPGRKQQDGQPSPALAQQIDERDRLFTLLAAAHQELRRGAFYTWAEATDAHVPPLFSFDGARRRAGTSEPPGPSPSSPPSG